MKPITETHPSLCEAHIDYFSVLIPQEWNLIQEHTVDKTILKKVIKQLAKEEETKAVDWEYCLIKELGLEEVRKNEDRITIR